MTEAFRADTFCDDADGIPPRQMKQVANTSLCSPAYRAAEQLLAYKGRSFHWARRLLNPTHANRATRLYGFCRRIDDLADETQCQAAAHDALDRIDRDLCAGISSDPRTVDAIRLMQECGIDAAIPHMLIVGVAGDLDPVCMEDENELLRYAYRVAGTVGLMMCATLDVSEAAALPHAIDLGIAMQLTNLCRDVHEDALSGRRYLPASLVGTMEPEQLVAPDAKQFAGAQAAIVALLDLADAYYESGESGLGYLPIHARSAILVAARIYRSIGFRLRRRSINSWARRAMVSATAKTAISARALLTLPACKQPPPHVSALHEALVGLPGINRSAGVRHG